MTKICVYIKDLSGRSTQIYVERNETIADGKIKYKIAVCNLVQIHNGNLMELF